MLFHGPVIYVDRLCTHRRSYVDVRENAASFVRQSNPVPAHARVPLRHLGRDSSEEQELLTASAAMIGSMGRESPYGEPQIMPPTEPLEAEKEEVEEGLFR